MSNIGKIGVAPQRRREQLTVPGAEGEFALGRDEGAMVSMADLMGDMEDAPGIGGLKKKLSRLEKAEPMTVPASKRTKDKLDREAAYNSASKDVGKWGIQVRHRCAQNVRPYSPFHFPQQCCTVLRHAAVAVQVQKNRQAEQLILAEEATPRIVSSASLANNHSAKTDMEKQVHEALMNAGMDEASIQKYEELELKSVSVEEVMARQKEVRATHPLSYSDLRFRRFPQLH